jgi:hypothetical protein
MHAAKAASSAYVSSEERKLMTWHSDVRGRRKRCTLREFITRSRLIHPSYDWKSVSRLRLLRPPPSAVS